MLAIAQLDRIRTRSTVPASRLPCPAALYRQRSICCVLNLRAAEMRIAEQPHRRNRNPSSCMQYFRATLRQIVVRVCSPATLMLWGVLALSAPAYAVVPQTGWWWNPNTPGTGFFIEQQNNTLFMTAFLYASNGQATWNLSLGPTGGST